MFVARCWLLLLPGWALAAPEPPSELASEPRVDSELSQAADELSQIEAAIRSFGQQGAKPELSEDDRKLAAAIHTMQTRWLSLHRKTRSAQSRLAAIKGLIDAHNAEGLGQLLGVSKPSAATQERALRDQELAVAQAQAQEAKAKHELDTLSEQLPDGGPVAKAYARLAVELAQLGVGP